MYENILNIDEFFEKYKNKSKNEYIQKCIMIDFDHIIGDFYQIVKLILYCQKIINRSLSLIEIYKILDQYEYIFRPKIFDIFKILNHSKNKFKIIAINTKNTNINFAEIVMDYIYKKINTNRIHDIILSTENQSHIDFISTYINSQKYGTVICNIDSTIYDNLDKEICLFIKCKKYIFRYSRKQILKKIPYKLLNINNSTKKKFNQNISEKIYQNITVFPRSSYNVTSIKIIAYIHEFINDI